MVASLLVGFAVLGLVSGRGAGATGYTASSYGSTLVGLLNQARAEHGLPLLIDTAELGTVAVSWSEHLGRGRALSHNPELQAELESHGSRDWTTYGENVGDAPTDDPSGVFIAYMQSPEHRANILDPRYRFVGVGVVFSGGTAWDTLDFVDKYSTTASPAPAPSHSHASAPSMAPREHASPEAQEPIATVDPPAPSIPVNQPVRLRPTRATPSAVTAVPRTAPRAVPRAVPPPTIVIAQVKQPFPTLSAATGRRGGNALVEVAAALTLALIAGHWLVQRR